MRIYLLVLLTIFSTATCNKKSETPAEDTPNSNSTNTDTPAANPALAISGSFFNLGDPQISWSEVDNASLVYELAVGTSQGADDVLAWQVVTGTSPLTLDPAIFVAGNSYHFSMRLSLPNEQSEVYNFGPFVAIFDNQGLLDLNFHSTGFEILDDFLGNVGAWDLYTGFYVDRDNNRILASAYSRDISNDWVTIIFGLEMNGTLDTSFGSGGNRQHKNTVGDLGDSASDITNFGNHLYTFGHSLSSGPSGSSACVWRYNKLAEIDTSFGANGVFCQDNVSGDVGSITDIFSGMDVDLQNNFYVCGTTRFTGNDVAGMICKADQNGNAITAFGSNGCVVFNSVLGSSGLEDNIRQVVVLASGDILGVGYAVNTNGDEDIILAKLDADGQPVTAFGTNGIVSIDGLGGSGSRDLVYSIMAYQGAYILTGEVVTTAANNIALIMKLDANGNVDSNFGDQGKVLIDSIAGGTNGLDAYNRAYQDPAGRLYICGRSQSATSVDLLVSRLNPDGTFDTSFGNNGHFTFDAGSSLYEECRSLAFLPSGKILASGYQGNGGDRDLLLLRIK